MDTPLPGYIQREWMTCKEEVFDCFLNNVFHFGYKSTSTNEGAHAVLKTYPVDRTGDMLTVCTAVHEKIMNDYNNITACIAQEYNEWPNRLRNIELLKPLFGQVALLCIGAVAKQIERTESSDPLPPCTGVHEKALGVV